MSITMVLLALLGFLTLIGSVAAGSMVGNLVWVSLISPSLRIAALLKLVGLALIVALVLALVWLLPAPAELPSLRYFAPVFFALGALGAFIARLTTRAR